MTAEATAQMNIRINAAVKSRGDEAICQAGCTPTEFLRKLWAGIASPRGGEDLVRKMLDLAAGDSEETSACVDAAKRERMEAVSAGAHLIEASLATYGLGVEALPSETNWDALHDEIIAERYGDVAL